MSFISTDLIGGQYIFNRYMPVAVPGMMSGMGSRISLPHTNTVSAVDTVTVTPPSTVDENTEYDLTVNGVTVSFTTDSSATPLELGTGLLAAIQADPIVYGLVDAVLDPTSHVITLTARTVDFSLLVTTNSAVTTNDIAIAKTVTSSENYIIPFGRLVGRKSTYALDYKEGVSAATLIDSATGYQVLGVTLSSQATEKVGLFNRAKDGYAFGSVMNVLTNTGTYKGVWIECVEPDLTVADTAYIAVSTGNEGKLTRVSSGNVSAASNITIVAGAELSFERNIVLCKVNY
jgi:hypothetical protein